MAVGQTSSIYVRLALILHSVGMCFDFFLSTLVIPGVVVTSYVKYLRHRFACYFSCQGFHKIDLVSCKTFKFSLLALTIVYFALLLLFILFSGSQSVLNDY